MAKETGKSLRLDQKSPPHRRTRRVLAQHCLAILAAVLPSAMHASATRAADAPPRVYRDHVEPHWLPGGTRFWYRNDLPGGSREFILVDAAAGSRRPAFDHAKAAAALAKATGQQVQPDRLPIEQLEFTPDAVILIAADRAWRMDPGTYQLSEAPPPDRSATSLPADHNERGSTRTGPQTQITFINRTGADIELFWLDSGADRRHYAKIKPGEQYPQHTYAGHVWLVTDGAGRTLGVYEAIVERSTAVVDGKTPTTRPAGRRRPTSRPAPAPGRLVSPDGKWEAFIKDNNLWLRTTTGGQESALSQDGRPGDGYSLDSLWWSPDSLKLAAMCTEPAQEHKVYTVESSPKDQLQPKLRTIDYLKPGDRIAHPRPRLFHVDPGRQIPLSDDLFANPWSIEDVRWSPDSSRFTFVYNQRGHQVLRLLAVDAATGQARPIIDELSSTFICYSGNYFCQWLGENEILWMSERDGWNHLWLYDAVTGQVKNQVTKGEWVVQGVVRVDEQKRQVWFRAGGIRPGQDPYYTHFCRVNLDGSGLVVLTEGDGNHSIQWSPGGEYLIDTWSRVDLPPVIELRRGDTGQLACKLEAADAGEVLSARGGRWPELFVARGRDGRTEIYGIVIFPLDFDPDKKYPVVENIYAGPQGFFTPKSFQSRYGHQQQIADRGMIVVQCDGMGTAGRSKAFHDVCWRNLRDAGFPDRIAWLKAAAAKFPQMDLARVGIYGGSAGGQSAMGALLWHGDFYKVAVADCGCHDNRMDKIWWNEQWMGWPVGKEYAENSNAVNAHLLQGKLMLVVGELDSNVDPASTMQVVSALEKANKDFDLVIVAGSDHGAAETPYGSRRRADFLTANLLAVAGPGPARTGEDASGPPAADAKMPSVASKNPPGQDDILPWKLPEQKNPAVRAVQDRLYRLAMLQARYILKEVHPWSEDSNLLLVTDSKSVEWYIRPNTATVEGLSFLCRHGPYDERLVGADRETLLAKTIIPMMRYLVATHVTGTRPTSDGKKWGEIKKRTHEQSTYWASMLGRAAWWTWDKLPDDLRRDVRRVLAYEADWVAANPPQFRLDFDTKSEENSWHCTVLSSALLLMPSDPRREKWEKTLQRYAISSFLRPADKESSTVVDGRKVSEQFEGANVFDDFTLENHGFVHPDYMGAFSGTLQCTADYAITGRPAPEALIFNVAGLYANLKWLVLPDGGYAFPNGDDWELFKAPDWMDVHSSVAVYLKDPDAWSNLMLCLKTTEKMQARDPLGPVYARQEYFYPGMQHEEFYQLVHEWMSLQVAGEIVDRPGKFVGVKRWNDGEVIVHRTRTGLHTLSWGARVMAQCIPLRLDSLVSPDPESCVGHVLIKGGKRLDPLSTRQAQRAPLHDVRIVDTPDGFTADLLLDHGPKAVRAELHFESKPDGSLLVREKLTALMPVTTSEIATGLIGVLDNPIWVYQPGPRRIVFDDQVDVVAPLSGKVLDRDAVKRINMDGGLEIISPAPLHVHYEAAKEPDHGRATDRLYLNYIGGEHTWKQGEVISEYEATIRPAATENQELKTEN